MARKKFLVTGGAGFIGSNLVEALLKRGHSVKVMDNFSTGKRENLKPFMADIELVEGDIRSYHLVQQAVKGVNVILHEAALPSVPRSIIDPITTNEVNIGGTLHVLETAKEAGVERVVFASSSSVYGNSPELPKHEAMTPKPMSPYAASKLAGEQYCRIFSEIYGLHTISLRYFNVFGPRQDPNSQYSAVIPKFIKAIRASERPVVYGDGSASRDFTYVENVIEGNLLAAEAECEAGIVMNCACHQRVTLNELIHSLNRLLKKEIPPIFEKSRKGDILHSYADISAAETVLQYKPVVNFQEGLGKTVDWDYGKEQVG
jgi:nucleoside-diphosphate-sugar epimerase